MATGWVDEEGGTEVTSTDREGLGSTGESIEHQGHNQDGGQGTVCGGGTPKMVGSVVGQHYNWTGADTKIPAIQRSRAQQVRARDRQQEVKKQESASETTTRGERN